MFSFYLCVRSHNLQRVEISTFICYMDGMLAAQKHTLKFMGNVVKIIFPFFHIWPLSKLMKNFVWHSYLKLVPISLSFACFSALPRYLFTATVVIRAFIAPSILSLSFSVMLPIIHALICTRTYNEMNEYAKKMYKKEFKINKKK